MMIKKKIRFDEKRETDYENVGLVFLNTSLEEENIPGASLDCEED